jgi:hypothetical protein
MAAAALPPLPAPLPAPEAARLSEGAHRQHFYRTLRRRLPTYAAARRGGRRTCWSRTGFTCVSKVKRRACFVIVFGWWIAITLTGAAIGRRCVDRR